MTLPEFSRDIVPILSLAVASLGLLSLFMVWWQIREARLWNRVTTQSSLTSVRAMLDIDKTLEATFAPLAIPVLNLSRPLTSEEVTTILKNAAAYAASNVFLSELEVLAAAANIGALDDEYVRSVHSGRVVTAFKVFCPFVDALRNESNDKRIYLELQRAALRWEEADLRDRKRHAQETVRIQERLQAQEARLEILRREQSSIGGVARRM